MKSVNRAIKRGNARIYYDKVTKSIGLEVRSGRGKWIRSSAVIPMTEENYKTVVDLINEHES